MAGSYNHCVDDVGRLRDPESLNDMLENGSDVYEAVEEMYGMIWVLAQEARTGTDSPNDMIEWARVNYKRGLDIAESDLP